MRNDNWWWLDVWRIKIHGKKKEMVKGMNKGGIWQRMEEKHSKNQKEEVCVSMKVKKPCWEVIEGSEPLLAPVSAVIDGFRSRGNILISKIDSVLTFREDRISGVLQLFDYFLNNLFRNAPRSASRQSTVAFRTHTFNEVRQAKVFFFFPLPSDWWERVSLCIGGRVIWRMF